MIPPKPASRTGRAGPLRHLRLMRRDLLSAQPERLYRARMAEFRAPFVRSVLVNEPELVDLVLRERPADFPKSDRIGAGLRPLLGRSVFLTNGEDWARQRRIVDAAFERGRLHDAVPGMVAAARAGAGRLSAGPVEIEAEASHIAADVIFRTLFSIPIDHADARAVFHAFRDYQRAAPVMRTIHWLPGPFGRRVPRRLRHAARTVRDLIERMVAARAGRIAAGTAPDDLATKLMTARDPATGRGLTQDEIVDQVAIFFLAGHETSAAALGWTLYLLARRPDWQDRVAGEIADWPEAPQMRDLSRRPSARDALREALRLYPPVPMMVREARGPETFRGRALREGTLVILSPWHLGRHARRWRAPDAFRPERWAERGDDRTAWLPFSAGPRVCPGAGFAMAEGVICLTEILRRWRVAPVDGRVPVPVAHLTVRARDGIWLDLSARET